MDHTAASAAEDGDGTAAIAQPTTGFAMDHLATEPTTTAHPSGATAAVTYCITTFTPFPAVKVSADLLSGTTSVGSGSVTVMTVNGFQLGLAGLECTPVSISFTLNAAVPAGTTLHLVVSDDYKAHTFPSYPGGTDGPSLVIG